MEIKGNIGEEVLLKGTIEKIMIDGTVTTYSVRVAGTDLTLWLDIDDLEFQLEEIPNEITVTRETDGDKRRQTETNGDPSREYEEMDEEWFTVEEQPKKKRGRPRKATVEDLMKRAKE